MSKLGFIHAELNVLRRSGDFALSTGLLDRYKISKRRSGQLNGLDNRFGHRPECEPFFKPMPMLPAVLTLAMVRTDPIHGVMSTDMMPHDDCSCLLNDLPAHSLWWHRDTFGQQF
jgi:hypothetical protein